MFADKPLAIKSLVAERHASATLPRPRHFMFHGEEFHLLCFARFQDFGPPRIENRLLPLFGMNPRLLLPFSVGRDPIGLGGMTFEPQSLHSLLQFQLRAS